MNNRFFISTLAFCLIHLFNIGYGQNTKTIDMTFVDQDTNVKDIISEQLLISKTWQTCAWINSPNEYPVYQFLPKDLTKGNNCTNNSCAHSDWSFKIEDGTRVLNIGNAEGCPGTIVLGGSVDFWFWRYDDVNNTINLKRSPKDESEITLLITTIDENRLVLQLITE